MEVRAQELKGQALAWAACCLWQVPACVMDGVVCVIQPDGQVVPFDPEAMLRSLVVGHLPTVEIPDELMPAAAEQDGAGGAGGG